MKKQQSGGKSLFFLPVLLILCELLFLFQIWRLSMLPLSYLALIAGVLVLLTCLNILLLNPKKQGQQPKNGRKILGCVLCVFLSAMCLIGGALVGQVADLIASVTGFSGSSTVLEVYVLADDPAGDIADTGNYTYGISQSTAEEDNLASLAEIGTQVGGEVSHTAYPSVFALIDALYAGQVNAIVMDSSYLSVLDSTDAYEDFDTRTRVLHSHVIHKPASQDQGTVEGLVSPEGKNPARTPFLLYISGNDARRALLANGGSDVNILVAVNPVTHQILMVNTPRDYYVENPAGDGARDKLSHCGLNGIENCIGAVSGLYGIPINHYARINFSGFRTLIDAIGGVTIHSDIGFTAGSTYIYPGENHLNGAQALSFARERKNLTGGDNDRGKNQMKLIKAMIDKLSAGNLIANYGQILSSLEGMFTTSISPQTIGKLVQLQLTQNPQWQIRSFAVTGDNGNDRCWAVGGGYGYVMYPHEDEVEFAADLIRKVLDGEILTDEDMILNP